MSYYPPPNQNFSGFSPIPNNPAGNDNLVYQNYPPATTYTSPLGFPPVQLNLMAQPGYPASGYPSPQQQPGGYPAAISQPTGYGDYQNTGGSGMPNPGSQQPATAPDLGQMHRIPGYEGVTFEDAVLVPPTFPVWKPDQQEQRPMQNLPTLSDEDVQAAVADFASEHCCYGSKVARDMEVREIMMMSAFHYKLETFSEKRESAWRFVPYHGQSIDGPSNGPAPSPWDMMATPTELFKNAQVKLEVPHTSFMKPCHTCVGNARLRCDSCSGNGRTQCNFCKGRGTNNEFDRQVACNPCNGSGFSRCFTCGGTGQVKCRTCDARGNLKGFVELTVTWTNHSDDFISETSRMPKELVLQVTGQVAYEEENPRVYPIMHASEEAVRDASNRLVSKHASAFSNERILRQKQCLRAIPIGQVKYQFKNKVDEFFVYGFEHKVYFKKYPQRCCCTIM